MRCLRVSVQAGLTPDRLGPRPDRSSAAPGCGPRRARSNCTDAFREGAGNVSHEEKTKQKPAQTRKEFTSGGKKKGVATFLRASYFGAERNVLGHIDLRTRLI